jgi:SPP1 gp7 family putative phage head morphogenesis protein
MTQSGVTQRLLDIEQYKRPIDRNQPIVNIYRNAIDLNRFSNAIARRIIVAYNDLIISAVNDLRAIDIGAATAGGGIISPDSVQAQRLRIILAQTKESLNTWTGRSINFLGTQLQGLAELETDFVAQQLRLALEGGLTEGGREVMASEIARRSVNTVAVTPDFAQAVVRFDPSDFAAVLPGTGPFTLNLADGAVMTLPNGQVLRKAFAKLAEDSQQKLGVAIRNGLLAGEPTPQIARRLIGSLQQGDTRSTIKQLAAKGGELTSLADNQVLALVRTSVNDVANAASQQVYKANPKVTQKYQYVATLDSRTSAICRTLDGKEFEYGNGPLPPQHYNCRSTTIPVIDWEGMGLTPPDQIIGAPKRASKDGQVAGDLDYANWLKNKPEVQREVFGSKQPYYQRLLKKYGANGALSRMVREDGSEVSLKELQDRYGNASA